MITGSAKKNTPEWQAEQDIIHEVTHDAATSIQSRVRGMQRRNNDSSSSSKSLHKLNATQKHAATNSNDHSERNVERPKITFKYKKDAATFLQKHFRAALARPKVRIQRGIVKWQAMNASDTLPSHGWIELQDPQRKPASRSNYYYNHIRSEYRWIKPSGIIYAPAHKISDKVGELSDKVDLASGVPAYAAHTNAADAIGLAESACKSASNKCKTLFAQERACRSDFVDDPQLAHAGLEMLEESLAKATKQVNTVMMSALKEAQSEILVGFSESLERMENEIERYIDSGLLSQFSPGKRKSQQADLPAMCRETATAVKMLISWWSGDREAVAEDTRIYLSLEGWNGKDRTDWFPLHMAIEAAGSKVSLIRQCLADAVHSARQVGERKREAKELQAMRMEEAAQRVLMRRKKDKQSSWMKHEKEMAMYRAAWARGLQLREEDRGTDENSKTGNVTQKSGIDPNHSQNFGAKMEASTAGSRLMRAFGKSPWVGAERGCNQFELEELINLERQRRKHQEGRDGFDVDHPEHDTGKILLHQACFWGHQHLVEYLLQRGSNPMGIDSVVTKFTPLDEAARGGSPHTTKKVLEAAGLPALLTRNMHGDTPVHTAARLGRSQALSAMIEFCKTDAAHGKKALRLAQSKGRSAASDFIFKLIELKSGKKRTPLQVTTSDGCREILLAANEWAIGAASDASVFGGGMKAAGNRRRKKNTNELGKWLQEMNPNAY